MVLVKHYKLLFCSVKVLSSASGFFSDIGCEIGVKYSKHNGIRLPVFILLISQPASEIPLVN